MNKSEALEIKLNKIEVNDHTLPVVEKARIHSLQQPFLNGPFAFGILGGPLLSLESFGLQPLQPQFIHPSSEITPFLFLLGTMQIQRLPSLFDLLQDSQQ